MASFLTEEVMFVCDSDMLFVRPLHLSYFEKKPELPLLRSRPIKGHHSAASVSFNNHSQKTLGLPSSTKHYDYAFPTVIWRRQTVLDLCEHISALHRKNWIAAIYGYRLLSESTLYGLFVDFIINKGRISEPEENSFIKGMRLSPPLDAQELDDFFNLIPPGIFALVIPSPIRFDISVLRERFSKILRLHQLNPKY